MSYFGIPLRNGVPIGLGSIAGFGIAPFDPSELFSAGEQGAWYDPSDLTTLFTDSAGTTPVTAVEQFVGLMLDKSKGGVGTNGAARYNLLTYSEDQSIAIWSNYSATQSSNVAVAPNGTTTADKIVEVAASAGQSRYNTITGLTSVAYTASMYFKQASGADRQYANLSVSGSGSANWFAATFDLTGAGAVAKTGAGASGTYQSSSITAVGNGWYHCIVTGLTGQTGTSYFYAGPSDISNPTYGSFGVLTYTGDTAKGVLVWGADLRLASQANLAPTYQRITDSWSATIPGNHATSTGTKRPKLAARYNLLTYSEQFDNAAWTASNIATPVLVTTVSPPSGSSKVFSVTGNAGSSAKLLFQGSLTNSETNRILFFVRMLTQRYVQVSRSGNATDYANFDLQAAQASAYGVTTATITPVGNSWYSCEVTFPSLNNSSMFIGFADSLSHARQAASLSTDTFYLGGADLRPASQATGLIGPTYQRVVDAATYDAVGFLPYLQFDGIDDSMSTGSIDFTATDKMTVVSGARLSRFVSNAMLYCTGSDPTSTAGTFALRLNTASNVQSLLFGSSLSNFEPTIPTIPSTNVLSQLLNIGAATTLENGIRVNGASATYATNGAGSGNFSATAPLHIGALGGTSNYIETNLYSLIIRGAQSTQSQIEATESWVAGKTGVSL